MPHICYDENRFYFPPVNDADEEGLLLIGGTVTPVRIIEAYTKGIFPWYNETELPLWWSPDPRFVLFPDDLHVSESMTKVLRKQIFQFKVDTAFREVIGACASIERKGQDGTWLTPEMKASYTELHYENVAHSAEAWKNGQLVGGVYGLLLGNVFFGESMFSKETNASKFAFINLVQQLQKAGIKLIDCQVHTPHVESLGGKLIPRNDYLSLLQPLVKQSSDWRSLKSRS